MTISANLNKVSFAGDGATTVFALGATYVFFASSELRVIETVNATGVETLQVITTNYTVTGGAGATGTVTMLVAPASGITLTIRRVMPLTQGVDLINNDPQDAEVVEDAFDKLTLADQQLDEADQRAVKLPETETADATIPAAITRRNKLMAFADTAAALPIATTAADLSLVTLNDPVAVINGITLDVSADTFPYYDSTTTADFAILTAFARTVLDDATAAAAMATLGVGRTLTTSGGLTGGGTLAADRTLSIDAATAAPVLFVPGTNVPFAAQTSILFGGIPSWAKRVTVAINAMDTSGTSLPTLRLGDSGGIEATGYTGSVTALAATAATALVSTGFKLHAWGAASITQGVYQFEHLVGNTWLCTYAFGFSNSAVIHMGAGFKTLTGALTQLQLTTEGGSDTLDATSGGNINVSYE